MEKNKGNMEKNKGNMEKNKGNMEFPEEGRMKTTKDFEELLKVLRKENRRSGRQLQMIDLSQVQGLTNKHLEDLTGFTGALKDLRFPFGDKNKQLSDEAIRALLRANKDTLISVTLSFNQRVTEITLLLLAECPHLQVVILRDCDGRTDKVVQELLRNCQSITHLDVSDDYMSGSFYGRTSPLTDAAFTYIPNSLQCLRIEYNQHLTTEMAETLKKSKIRSISWFGSKNDPNPSSKFLKGDDEEWPTF